MNIEVNSKEWLSLEDLPSEEWRDIKGYEGLYKISNLGRVKSLTRFVNTGIKHSDKRKVKEKICKVEFKKGSSPYCRIQLRINHKYNHYNIHNLVANAFLDKKYYKCCSEETNINPNNLEINHKDENLRNNTVDNLEWCTHLYNMRYGTRLERAVKKANETKKRKKGILYE